MNSESLTKIETEKYNESIHITSIILQGLLAGGHYTIGPSYNSYGECIQDASIIKIDNGKEWKTHYEASRWSCLCVNHSLEIYEDLQRQIKNNIKLLRDPDDYEPNE